MWVPRNAKALKCMIAADEGIIRIRDCIVAVNTYDYYRAGMGPSQICPRGTPDDRGVATK